MIILMVVSWTSRENGPFQERTNSLAKSEKKKVIAKKFSPKKPAPLSGFRFVGFDECGPH